MKRAYWVATALIAIVAFSHGGHAQTPQSQADAKKWVTEAASDEERFQRIEKQLRGFDQPMWEVGARYEKLHAALLRENFELASYHWAKIKLTIVNGTLKRPARRPSADAFLLTGGTWDSIDEAFRTGDPAKAWKGFEAARASCIACHDAEEVGYMNDQPMFSDLLPMPID